MSTEPYYYGCTASVYSAPHQLLCPQLDRHGKKSLSQSSDLDDLNDLDLDLGYGEFKSSTRAKEKPSEIQQQIRLV